jgi:hypothetical protein
MFPNTTGTVLAVVLVVAVAAANSVVNLTPPDAVV